MTTTTDFILEVQEKGSEKISDVRDKVEDLTTASKANAAASDKMASGMDKVERKTRLASKAVDKLKGGYEKLGSVQGIVMALASAAIIGYAAKIADAASTLNGFSDDLGIDVQKLQVYSDVASLAGSSIEGVAGAIKGLNEATKEGSFGNEKIAQIFKDLNINIKEFDKLKPEEKIDKLSKSIQGFSTAEQDYIIKSLKADGLAKVLKSPDEVNARADYLKQNGLIVNKEEVSTLNEFTDLWTNLMTDITNFSTITLGNFAKGLKDIFDMNPSEKNTLLNRESSKKISDFMIKLVAVFKTFYELTILAGDGVAGLVDKGVFWFKSLDIYFRLFNEKINQFSKDFVTFFENITIDELIVKFKKGLFEFGVMAAEKFNEIRKKLGGLLNIEVDEIDYTDIEKTRAKFAEEEKKFSEDQAKRNAGYNESETKYEEEKNKLAEEKGVINRLNEQRTIESNKKIRAQMSEVGKAYDNILYAGRKKNEQQQEEVKTTTKTLTNLDAQKKSLAELNSLEALRVQNLQLQGKNIEANELQRKIAISKLDETFKDTKNKAEATDIINALFDENKLKIKLDDVSKELDNLKLTQSELTPFNENWNSIADQIANKTKEQIELQKQLKIAVKETDDQNLLSLENLKAGNQALTSGLKDSLKDYITGAKTASEAISSFFENIANKILDAILQQLILNAVTAAFGGSTGQAASGSSGLLTSIAGFFGGSKSSTSGSAGTASSRHNGLAGGEITQGTLIKPEGYNFSHDEGFIVAKAGESVGTKQQLAEQSGSENQRPIHNQIMIDGDSLTDKLFKTQSMDRNLDNYFKKNGPLIKNYFK